MTDDAQLEFLNDDAQEASTSTKDKLRRVAKYQRTVIVALVANLVVSIVARSARELPPLGALALLFLILCVVVIAVVSIFLLGRELYSTGMAVVCAVLMFVPCVSLITLLIVNQSATKFLQQHGVQVGFFGVDPARIP